MTETLVQAAGQVLDPTVLVVIAVAALYGTFFGSIPGLSARMAVALVVPLTYFLDPLPALATVVKLSACAISAGDIPRALVRIPGTRISQLKTISQIAGMKVVSQTANLRSVNHVRAPSDV